MPIRSFGGPHAIDVETAAPEGATNCYVVDDEAALLVDPAGRDEGLETLLQDAGVDVGHVAVTHHHPDHVGAVAWVAEATDATVWCRTGRERAFEGATGVAADRTFHEGTRIETGNGAVTVLDTPGHAPEHVAFSFSDPEGAGEAVLSGDLAVAEGSVVVGAPEGDLRAYLTSLRRLHARHPDRLLPGHGPVVGTPRETLRRLLGHRLDREERVLTAVGSGARTVGEVTDAAYEKDVSHVRSLAEATVRAHLEKLAVEARVVFDGERATPT
ncbi:MBL fold metallo-hydrolase [Halomarina oriensis]|uniref:MBL fold metallo-hydrolase n=1 Tax=Halomarina oriensis TaxID=671145 RepID=A0A6B0GLE2_9EURY|nr:MBL fold metallo-hydrolase [Halomarina oriensis]MWG35460.1 MBL fold metallo-hydrolase [Halomarina oriensis]